MSASCSTRHLLGIALGALLALAGCQEPGAAELSRGNRAAARGELEEALEAYRAAASARPRSARPRELEGHVLLELRRPAEARAAYEAALALEPEAVEAQVGLARLEAAEGHVDEALKRLDALLARSPDQSFALVTRATVLLRRGTPADVERALTDGERALRAEAGEPGALYVRGSALLAANQHDEAGQAFERLREARPDLPLAAYGLARLASARGDEKSVFTHLHQARERAGNHWHPEEVLADPLFGRFRQDTGFRAVVGSP
jgi:tetratricopeptide (TPR) repeat protein